ncbi:hypothetical protein Xmau_00783 [Xenorhabdus mauleonii]|uniref:Uncharacterized protein n=1 Tax=Xenorhabdus mauleonii TaxID=351675 RepID=A0A1I3S1A0_9GAMM|nr:hypothetical protein Xmau_00783 [Xenorhabdus mauleonii]SFJ51306.1 hypothetical protein SAMN05421680_110109 [Xenorhabdus mauleonii]
MVKEKWVNAKGLFSLSPNNEFIIGLLRVTSQLVDISSHSIVADDEKRVRIVDNPA